MLKIQHSRPLTSTICLCRQLKLYQNLIVYQSTNAISMKNDKKKSEIHSEYPVLDTKFNQYQIAYRYRHTSELLRGYFVYRLFSINFFVNNQEKIAHLCHRIFGDRLFQNILKLTAFGHFVGGENPQELIPVIKNLQMYNVKPILDYSVESDDTNSLLSLDEIDRIHNHNTEKFIECIKTSREICGENNLIAIKVTALVQPSVLKKLNTLLKSIKIRSSLPPLFQLINQEQTNEKTVTFIEQSVNSVLDKDSKQELTNNPTFISTDVLEIFKLLLRLNKIAQACVENQISIMVDAEQSYYQTAINYLATELQRYYNKNHTAFIYNTYQCYLKETFDCIKHDLILAEKFDYIFAAKLVRGAYMEQERRLARENNSEDPLNSSYEATSQMYHQCLDELLKNTIKYNSEKIRVMIASHNEDTIRYALQKMKDFNISRDSSMMSFASLYGMNDYVTFALVNSGYKAYKYVPYGPIEALQPYLFRRAQENRSIFEKADKDRRFHFKAFKDRILNRNN